MIPLNALALPNIRTPFMINTVFLGKLAELSFTTLALGVNKLYEILKIHSKI